MSLPIPLAVRLVTSRQDRHVTRDLRDLTFRSVAPGGFASIQMSLDRPLSLQPDEITYYGRAVVYDIRNGNTVCEGRLEDPGRSAGADGEVWELAALGPSAHASDRAVPYIMVDRDMTAFLRANNSTPGGRDSVTDDPGGSGNKAILLHFPQGLTVNLGTAVTARYDRLRWAGQKLARVDYTWDAGGTDANYTIRAATRDDGNLATGELIRNESLSGAGGAAAPKVVVTHFPNGRNTIEVSLVRATAGPATIPNDGFWVSVMDMVVVAMRYNKDGTERSNLSGTDYTTNTVLASEIVADLLGRLLTQYDGANATIATTSHPIEQLAYPDGVTARKVLEDLMLLEPAYYWAAWEQLPSGKHRFEWTTWPTTVRYEASVDDGYQSTGSSDGLYDAVQVRWRDVDGQIRTNRRTQTVPELAAAGIPREALIDLGDEVGSNANANRAGDQWLAEHKTPPNAGRLTIARPILDMTAGRMVQPWEIRPGNLIRVRGILPRVDALNASARDGVTVFRIVGTTFRASSASVELELDSYPLTVSQALAELARRPVARRRR